MMKYDLGILLLIFLCNVKVSISFKKKVFTVTLALR
jgi:hypothetical protein